MKWLQTINNKIDKLATRITGKDADKYAAVLLDDDGKLHGFFKIAGEEDIRESVRSLVKYQDELPVEIVKTAAGVINEISAVSNQGWPVFVDAPTQDNNLIKSAEIDKQRYAEKFASASGEGYVLRDTFFPLDSAANVKAAGQLLEENESSLTGKERIGFAIAIKQASENFDVDLNESVEKYAHEHLNPDFQKLIDQRIKIAEHYPETVEVLRMIKDYAGEVYPQKVAEALHVVDNMMPFALKFAETKKLGSRSPVFSASIHVPDAYATVYGSGVREKTLAEKIADAPNEQLSEVFSPVFIKQLRKNPTEVLKTASPEAIRMLEEVTRSHV